MKLTANDVVPDAVKDYESDLRYCPVEKKQTFHIPQDVMLLSASGARAMRLWVCESHLLPDTVTDDPDEEVTYNGVPARCDAEAVRGTGTGVCNARLDERGQCPLASKHL